MLTNIKFFLFMSSGLLLWYMFFPSTNLSVVDIIGIAFFATLFRWLYESFWKSKQNSTESS